MNVEGPDGGAESPEGSRLRSVAGHTVGPVARRVFEGIAVRVAERVAVRVEQRMSERIDRLAGQADELRRQLAGTQRSLRALGALDGTYELLAAGQDALREVQAQAVNQELLKAQVLAVSDTIGELGRAIAPDAGLAGAAARLEEVRSQLNRLDRAVRELRAAPPAAGAPATRRDPESTPSSASPEDHRRRIDVDSPPTRTGAGDSPESTFDYVGFERRFRGDPAAVTATLCERYIELLRGRGPVLDIGCGSGEFVGALGAAGIDAHGVDPDPGMVEEARSHGFDVVQGDAISDLRSRPEQSLGAITAIHVIEHLPFPELCAFVALAQSRLRPGGLLICETPNPTSLIVLGHSYILDPTHQWPLHPSLTTFLCEQAGFAHIDVRYHGPADFFAVPTLSAEDIGEDTRLGTVNQALTKLNDVLFGPQEYAVIARA